MSRQLGLYPLQVVRALALHDALRWWHATGSTADARTTRRAARSLGSACDEALARNRPKVAA